MSSSSLASDASSGAVASKGPASLDPARRSGPRAGKGGWYDPKTALWMVAPAVLLISVFTFYPYAYALWSSFQMLSPILPASFAGMFNYEMVITSSYFVDAIRSTLIFIAISTPLTLCLGVAVAALFTQRFVGNRLLKALILLPWAIPASTTGVIWKWVFADSFGALNAMLYSTGIISDYIHWLSTRETAIAIVVLAYTWTQFPFAAVMALAAMQAIPGELYEAAQLDGCGAWRRFIHVTLPIARPMLLIVAIYEILVGLTTFDITYSLTGGGPGTATTFIGYFTYAESFKMLNFGNGAALAVLMAGAALLLIFTMLQALPKNALLER